MITLDNTIATCVETLEAHSGWVNAIAFHSKKPLMITGGFDKIAKLWYVDNIPDKSTTTCIVFMIEHSKSVLSVAFYCNW